MRLQSSVLLLLSALTCVSSETCKTLSDDGNTLAASMKDPAVVAGLQQLEQAMPWASTCLASVNYTDITAQMFKNPHFSACLDVIAAAPMRSYSDSRFYQSDLCPLLNTSAVSCLGDVLLDTFSSIVSASGGCCDDMVEASVANFKAEPPQLLMGLFKRISNVLCSSKSYVDGKKATATQFCGHSILFTLWADMRSFFNGFFQLPNNQGCKAIDGKPFKTTNGSDEQLSTSEGEDKLGICYQPIDELFQYMAKWPFMQSTPPNSTVKYQDLFNNGTCAPAGPVFKMILSNNSAFSQELKTIDGGLASVAGSSMKNVTRSVFSFVGWYMRDMTEYCLHFANNLTCAYTGTLTKLFADVDAMPETHVTNTTKAPATTAPTKNTTTTGANSVSSVTGSFLAMVMAALFLLIRW